MSDSNEFFMAPLYPNEPSTPIWEMGEARGMGVKGESSFVDIGNLVPRAFSGLVDNDPGTKLAVHK